MQEQQVKQYVFQDTTARKKIWELKKRIRAVKGGTAAAKTISIIKWHIDFCQQKYNTAQISTIASESFPHLDLGAIRDFKAIMKDRGYWKDNQWNATKSFYTFETGNILEFMSVDTYSKAHGPRRDTLFLNECNNLPWIIVDQLMLRTRKIVWMDWNPTESFWFHEQILPFRPDEVDYITLTYKDNEALDEISIREIESHKHDVNWWNVYGLGNDGATESRIYKNWGFIDEIPKEARLVRKWLDFGYTNDPTSTGDIYEYDGGYILDEGVYETGMVNADIAKVIGKDKELTIGDSAEPKSIRELQLMGINIIGATKGKGSISQGIDTVRAKKILVTKRSLNVIKEYRNYIWQKDKDGKIINTPRDLFNHAMDGIRYAISNLNPVNDEDESTYEQPSYELPGALQSEIEVSQPQPTIQTVVVPGGTFQERMKILMERKEEREDDYQQPDYETPLV